MSLRDRHAGCKRDRGGRGEEGDEDRRTRRQRYRSSSSPVLPIVLTVMFVGVGGVGLYFVMQGQSGQGAPRRPNAASNQPTAQEPAPTTSSSDPFRPAPKNDEDAVFYIIADAKKLGYTPKAVEFLRSNLGKYPAYDCEIYAQMGYRSTSKSDKAQFYAKALELASQGGKFQYGDRDQRLKQLKDNLEQAQKP
jgi:hypothetical protein